MRLVLLIFCLLVMVTARSPLEMLASSVQAIRQLARGGVTISERPEDTPPNHRPAVHGNRRILPPAFILLSPVWDVSKETSNNRRQDLEFAENKKVQQIMLTWPAQLALPSRKIPLRFIATMAVPISQLTTDPLLTKGELSEVVYYSNMDLRKLNITDKDKIIIEPNGVNIYDEMDEESTETYYDETETVQVTTPAVTTVRTTTTTASPTPIAAVPINDFPVMDDERQRRTSWPHEGSSHPRAILRDRHMLDWMDGESIAYIVVGTCCGISVLTLAIVLLVFRLRGAARRTPPSLDVSSNQHADNSSIGSYSSDDSNSIQLPEKLLNLLNSHSQEASTHKLGSWFNGKPSTLSMRHGANMAFPATVRKFQVEDTETVMVRELASEDILATTTSEFAIEEEEGDDQSSSSDVQCDRGNTTSMEGAAETIEESAESTESIAGSKHDTFIFWSTNSDRLV